METAMEPGGPDPRTFIGGATFWGGRALKHTIGWKGAAFACAFSAAVHLAALPQDRFNVLASALASSDSVRVEKMAVSGFAEGASGQSGPLAGFLEEGLREALRQRGAWTVLDASQDSAAADALLTGTYSREGQWVRVHAVLLSLPERTVLWSRNMALEQTELDPGLLKDPGPWVSGVEESLEPEDGGDGMDEANGPAPQVVPSLPRRIRRHARHPFHYDLNIAYKAFFPTNSSLQRLAGTRMDGLSLGMSFNDVVQLDADFWSQGISGLGSVQSLDYAGSSLGLTYPLRFGHWLCLYLGPGGRFGSVVVNDTQLDYGSVSFGNNALVGMAGAKFTMDSVGLDLRYTYDLVSSYTGYHTARLGFFYEFGH
jgi:hypothetical protein